MRKYSLPVRIAALLCALCLLLTGCGQVAVPDDPGEPGAFAPTAEPAAEETKSAIDDLGLTEVEKLAAQLAAEHLGQDTALTNAVDFSSDDSDPDAYHVLLLKDTRGNYLAYRYGTGSVYCLSEEEARNYHENVLDAEEDTCTHLLYILSRRTANYFPDWETVTKLTPSELEEVNQMLARGEVLAPDAEETQASQEEQEAAQRARKAVQVAAQLAAEHLGRDAVLTNAVDYSIDDFDGAPCHVLLLRNADDRYLAYSYDTEAVYCPASGDFRNGTDDSTSTEESRYLYLLWVFANRSDCYLRSTETRIELTAAEIAKANWILVQGDAAAQEETEAAELAAQLAAEHWGQNTTLTNVEDYSIDDFEGAPCHVLLMRDADDRFLAYSYDTETVYCPSSDEVWNGTNDLSTEEGRCLYLLCSFANRMVYYLNDGETRTELTAAEIAKANWALVPGGAAAQGETEAVQLAAQLAAEHWGQDAALTAAAELSTDVEGTLCHVLLLRGANDEFLAYSYSTEAVYSLRSEEVMNYPGDCDLSTEEGRCTYLLLSFAAYTGNYWSSGETLTELTAAEIAKVNRALALGIVPAAEPAAEEVATTLSADAALPEGSGAYKVLDECPEEFSRRELSDEEIRSLAQEGDLETARGRISTGGDFAAWLAALGGQFYSGITSDGVKQKTIGADFSFVWVRQMIDSNISASLAVRVLGDDLPGIGIVAARVAENDDTVLFGNLIPAKSGGYYLISFDALTDEWEAAVEEGIRPEAFLPIWVDGFAGITAWCQSTDNPRGNTLMQAFYISGDQQVVLNYKDELYIPGNSSAVQEFFQDEALTELTEQRNARINPENIGNYMLSTKLGGTTLTPEEAYALLDMEPEQVKERVKTAADVLMLMLAGQYGHSGGSITAMINGQPWQHNLTAFQVMETRSLNCGAAANLANYLLEGDYEEVGFILQAYYIGNGGGHVYNYFKYQGKYYIVDFSWYMFNDYEPGRDFPVMEAEHLEDLGSQLAEFYGGVCMVLAHTSPGQHYPNVFDDQNEAYAIPEGVEYQLLYQVTASGAYTVKEYPLDRSQLDWTTFGEP